MVYIVRCNNSVVTDFYLNIIGEILQETGKTVKDYEGNRIDKKRDIVVVATVVDFVKLYVKGFKKVIFWMQGIESEESYLKHGSKIRKIVLDFLTRIAIKKSIAIFYVSDEMRKFEEKKFNLHSLDKSFIMPCFNVTQNEKLEFNSEKYKKNIFTYVGSLSEWQCFSETIDFYKKIELLDPNSELHVYTFQKQEAKRILQEKEVINFRVQTVEPEKMTEALANVKFGFVLRKDISVNNVATPTKLSSYLSAGVIPIFSECLKDFFETTQGFQYVIAIDNKMTVPEKLKCLLVEEISSKDVEKEYSSLFLSYYNPSYYKQQFVCKMEKLLRCIDE